MLRLGFYIDYFFNSRANSYDISPASEPCFSAQTLMAILEQRLTRLLAVPGTENPSTQFDLFLEHAFLPTLNKLTHWRRTRLSFERKISATEKTPSPPNFCFYNALRRPNGQFVYLDFESFGWDGPAKTVCGFLLYPAMDLPETLRRQFATILIRCFSEYPRLFEHMEPAYPLYSLKWCIILLNKFLPEHLRRRQFAQQPLRRSELRHTHIEQLTKARRMLKRVEGEYEHFTYHP